MSNSGRAIVDANLDALGIRRTMAFSLSLDDVIAGKPDPAPFREAARRFALPPAAIVAIEDSEAGVHSAREAGLYVIGYAPEGGAIAAANRTIAQLTDVLALFKG